MHRSLTLLILLFFGSLGSAFAACPATSPTCGNPLQTGTSGSVLYAKAYGVKADGITSDDVALNAAVTACSAAGTRLILPPGKILLTGVAGTIRLVNCKLQGTGVPGATLNAPASFGTTFIVTNTTTSVFTGGATGNNTGGSGFSMEGFGVFYPDQTINVVYPPFFTDIGTAQVDGAYIHNVQFINCYQCFLQAANSDWSNWTITDSSMYAVLDGINVYSTCDSWRMSNVHFTHGYWVYALAGSPGNTPTVYTVNSYINAAAAQNSIIHVPIASGCGVTIIGDNNSSFAWRYGILVETGAKFINSPFSGSFDGVGTFLKLNGTGSAQGTTFSGSGWVSCVVHFATSGVDTFGCSPGTSSAPAAFDLGVGVGPSIKDYLGSGQGSFITSAGANITVDGADVSFGTHNNGTTDTTDYYCAHTTANPGGTGLLVQNLHCSPQGTTGTKMHGVVSDAVLNLFTVQGLDIINANEAASTATGGGSVTFTGNTARSTQGSVSVAFSGTGQVLYYGNNVDKPASATLTAGCNGTGAAVLGGIRGNFTPDTSSASTCDLTLPWVPYGGAAACQFFPRQASALNAFQSATKTWTITIVSGTATFAHVPISFDCTGIQ